LPLLGGGCDTGTQATAPIEIGPALEVVGFNGSSGQVPDDGTIQIAFNRLLAPSSVTRQSFVLYDSEQNFPEPLVTYDPVTRVVSLSNPNLDGGPSWLMAGNTYTLKMGVAAAGDYIGGSGPRAIDNVTLAAPVVETFQAVTPSTPTPAADRPIDFCDDVLPIFQLRCSAGQCHGAPFGTVAPAEGLLLETSLGVANTAINRVSQESNTGPLAGVPQPQGEQFGVDMAIVGTFDPGASWLMYKVLLGQVRPIDQTLDAGVATCGNASAPASVLQLPSPQPTLTLPLSEEASLSQYILGNQMPYPLNLAANEQTPAEDFDTLPLTFDELERVRAWITQGANVEACNACPSTTE
jgi:hypothetical protein